MTAAMRLTALFFALVPLLQAADPTPKPADPKKERKLAPGGKWFAGDMERPRPKVITPPEPGKAPSDAIVLFGPGSDLSLWKREPRKDSPPAEGDVPLWVAKGDYFECTPKSGAIRTRKKHPGDQHWHIEFATPSEVKGNSQGRGNSGVFISSFPEVQVLDSYQNDTYPDGQAAALYHLYPPMVNASRKPGEWQTYDIIIERQKKDDNGKVIQKARMTVIHNGIPVHIAREFATQDTESDLSFQDHGNPVRYRNIWVRQINTNDPDALGTPPAAKK